MSIKMKPDVPLVLGFFNFISLIMLFFSTLWVFFSKVSGEKHLLKIAMKWFLVSLLMVTVGFGSCSMFYEWRLG